MAEAMLKNVNLEENDSDTDSNSQILQPKKKHKIDKLKTPETIKDIIHWGKSLKKDDMKVLSDFIKDSIEEYEYEYEETPDEEVIETMFQMYCYDEKAIKLARIQPALEKLDNMIGMESIKKSIVDFVLYYVEDFHNQNTEYLHTIITGPPGCGKCLAPETLVRKYDGRIVEARYLKPGDELIDDSGNPTKITATTGDLRPTEQMFRIEQSHAEPYVVNASHILTLILTKAPKIKETEDGFEIKYTDKEDCKIRFFGRNNRAMAKHYYKHNIPQLGHRIDIALDDYFKKSKKWRSHFKGFRAPIQYLYQSNYPTIEQRMNYIADKCYKNNSNNEMLVDDSEIFQVLEIIFSLGWSAKYDQVETYSSRYLGEVQPYRITINEEKFSSLKITPLGSGEYFGFELQGSGRFLLADFTVTHNTTVAEILGEIYSNIGILHNYKFTNLSRSDLIAKYLGQSAIKTKEALERCIGGVAFIDEVYSLAPKDSDRDSFAKEVIDTLNQFLSEHKNDFVCIIAGYKDDIDKTFFAMNKGLKRRFPWRFDIEPYSPTDLVLILKKMIKELEWDLEPGLEPQLETLFKNNKHYFKYFGGDVETFLTKCKFVHVKRVFNTGQRKVFNLEDFEKGMESHTKHYDREGESPPPIGMYM
jgi:hypothetical protein